MSRKAINLGKVKGRTLDLKVEDNIIKKKYDDETEWQELVEVPDAGVSVVDTVNDLPADAKKDSVAFVKEETFVERVEQTEEVPLVIQDGEQILNLELKQDAIYFSDVNLADIHPELSGEDTVMTVYCEIETPDNEIEITYNHTPASMVYEELGVNHSVDFYTFETYNSDDSFIRWINLKGISAKDFVVNMMGLSLPEEYLQILCGEHYEDETADNPSYGWVKQYATSYPINENSLYIDGVYATIEYNAVADLKLTGTLDYFEIGSFKSNGDKGISLDVSFQYPEDYEPEEWSTALGCANTFMNLLFHGGVKETSYDVYSKKGFYKFDGDWKSLEEEMNIPKVVEKYSDLPKSFIENGIMAVANEEIVGQPTTKLESSVPVSIKVNPTPSVQDEIEKIKQHLIQNGFSADKGWNNYVLEVDVRFTNESGENIAQLYVNTDYISENDFDGIQLQIRGADIGDTGYYIVGHYYYFDEAGAEIYLPGTDSSSSSSIYVTDEGKCWYYVEHRDNGKNGYLYTPPKKVEFDDWFELLKFEANSEIYITAEVESGGYVFELDSYEFASLLKVYDSRNSLVYPKGFYMYAKNRWWHQPEIAGESFDNADVLRAITEEDIGTLKTMTEDPGYLHYHDNWYMLDGLSYDYLVDIARSRNSKLHRTENIDRDNDYLSLDYQYFTEIYLPYNSLEIYLSGYNYCTTYGNVQYEIPEYNFAINITCSSEHANLNIRSGTYPSFRSYPIKYLGYGNNQEPVFESGYRYEFSVLNGVAVVNRMPL